LAAQPSVIARQAQPQGETSVAGGPTSPGRGPRAFTLVELLVVIAVIGILVSLILPAVFSTREASRRVNCTNNLRQIGLALQHCHESTESFPPGGIEWRPPNDPSKRQLAWCVFLLPYLEQQTLYDQLDLSQAFDSPANAPAAAMILPVFICPSSPRGAQRVDERGPCDYGGIYGERIQGPNDPPKGIMVYDRRYSSSDVSDGLSNTLIVAEDTEWPEGQWINGRNLFDQAFPINAAPAFENDIRSRHPGGANGVLANGSVRFLSDSMDLQLLAALCTRAGGEPVGDF
jgi:prepilin-type N-terminal cleavage/methylation domain-containing protein